MTQRIFKQQEIATYTGRGVSPFDIREEDISLIDIAHSLSNLCRFTGHTSKFYSVAEHSVRCYDAARTDKLWVLLHDASEAYINDIARPLKESEAYAAYRIAEERIMKVIADKFDLEWPEPKEVKTVDYVLCSTEIRDLMWGEDNWMGIPPLPEKIITMNPEEAEREFLDRLLLEGLNPYADEDNESIEDFMQRLEARMSEFTDDGEDPEPDDAGGAGVVLTPIKPKPFFGAELKPKVQFLRDGKWVDAEEELELVAS